MIWNDDKIVAWNRQTPERFWARVDCTGECWEWQGAVNSTGYGSVGWHGKTYVAHRVAAWLTGLVDAPAQPKNRKGSGHVLHHCDNRRCCRPDHLYVGTYSRNQLDAYERGRRSARRSTHVNAKLTADQVRVARRAYITTPSYAELARRFGVSESAMSKIIQGRTYADVE